MPSSSLFATFRSSQFHTTVDDKTRLLGFQVVFASDSRAQQRRANHTKAERMQNYFTRIQSGVAAEIFRDQDALPPTGTRWIVPDETVAHEPHFYFFVCVMMASGFPGRCGVVFVPKRKAQHEKNPLLAMMGRPSHDDELVRVLSRLTPLLCEWGGGSFDLPVAKSGDVSNFQKRTLVVGPQNWVRSVPGEGYHMDRMPTQGLAEIPCMVRIALRCHDAYNKLQDWQDKREKSASPASQQRLDMRGLLTKYAEHGDGSVETELDRLEKDAPLFEPHPSPIELLYTYLPRCNFANVGPDAGFVLGGTDTIRGSDIVYTNHNVVLLQQSVAKKSGAREEDARAADSSDKRIVWKPKLKGDSLLHRAFSYDCEDPLQQQSLWFVPHTAPEWKRAPQPCKQDPLPRELVVARKGVTMFGIGLTLNDEAEQQFLDCCSLLLMHSGLKQDQDVQTLDDGAFACLNTVLILRFVINGVYPMRAWPYAMQRSCERHGDAALIPPPMSKRPRTPPDDANNDEASQSSCEAHRLKCRRRVCPQLSTALAELQWLNAGSDATPGRCAAEQSPSPTRCPIAPTTLRSRQGRLGSAVPAEPAPSGHGRGTTASCVPADSTGIGASSDSPTMAEGTTPASTDWPTRQRLDEFGFEASADAPNCKVVRIELERDLGTSNQAGASERSQSPGAEDASSHTWASNMFSLLSDDDDDDDFLENDITMSTELQHALRGLVVVDTGAAPEHVEAIPVGSASKARDEVIAVGEVGHEVGEDYDELPSCLQADENVDLGSHDLFHDEGFDWLEGLLD